MHEPVVALTDLLLGVECAVLFAMLRRSGAMTPLRRSFLGMFAAVGAAAVIGAFVHAFLPDETTLAFAITWRATLLIVGAAAIAAFLAGAYLLLPPKHIPMLRAAAAGSYIAYLLWLFLVSMKFKVAIAYYLPATLFLLAAFIAVRRSRGGAAYGAAGILLTLVAAVIQQARVGIDPVHFDHNALYHVVQMAGLWLVFLGARQVTGEAHRS